MKIGSHISRTIETRIFYLYSRHISSTEFVEDLKVVARHCHFYGIQERTLSILM